MKSLGKHRLEGINTGLTINAFVGVMAITFFLGFSILALSSAFDYRALLIFIFGIPFGLLVLTVLPVIVTKVKRLTTELRWWHFLWLLLFLSGLVFRIRGAGTIEENPLDLWALYRIGLMGFVAFVLLGRIAMHKMEWVGSLFRGLIGLMAGYALVSVASTLWSVYPFWSLYKSAEYLIDVALIAAIVAAIKTSRDFKTLFDLTWLLVAFLISTVWLGMLTFPEGAIERGVGLIGIQVFGVLPVVHANNVGQLGAILGIVAFTRLLFPQERNRFYFVILGFGMATLVLAQSRSSLTGFLAAMPLVLFIARRIGTLALFIGLTIALLFLTGAGGLFDQFFQRGQNEELFSSLTGRVYWWNFGWDAFKDHPLFGQGAYAAARFAVLAKLGFAETSHIHNTWLEIALGVGLVGLLFVVGAFAGIWITLLRFAIRTRNEPLTKAKRFPVESIESNVLPHQLLVEAMGVLTILSVRSVFESELIWHPALAFLVVLGYAEFLRRSRLGDSR